MNPSLLVCNEQDDWPSLPGDLHADTEKLVDILHDLHDYVWKHGVDLSGHSHDFLKQLAKVGARVYKNCIHAKGETNLASVGQQNANHLSIDVLDLNSGRSVLWEMLYCGNPFITIDPNRFWGFRYRLGRSYQGNFPHSNFALGKGALTAIHEELKHSREEIRQLAERLRRFAEEHRLGSLDLCDLSEHLGEEVDVVALLDLLTHERFNHGLIHFACHCDHPKDTGSQAEARLRVTVDGKALHILLDDLLSARGHYTFKNRPFVFLNACQSATANLLYHRWGFPTGILGLGAGGVIATACAVPDQFAGAFADTFYKHLLSKPSPEARIYIGEALLETRRYFLERYNNPLGLAYGLYATADQRLLPE